MFEMKAGAKTTESTIINLEINNNKKSFKIAEQMNFSAYETCEIASSLNIIGNEYIKSVNKKFTLF